MRRPVESIPYLPVSGVRVMRAWAMPAEQVSPHVSAAVRPAGCTGGGQFSAAPGAVPSVDVTSGG
jgi:hypothetical protein